MSGDWVGTEEVGFGLVRGTIPGRFGDAIGEVCGPDAILGKGGDLLLSFAWKKLRNRIQGVQLVMEPLAEVVLNAVVLGGMNRIAAKQMVICWIPAGVFWMEVDSWDVCDHIVMI
jgi:hypothetical protein